MINLVLLFIIMLLVNYNLYIQATTEIKNKNIKLKEENRKINNKYSSLEDGVKRLIYKVKGLPQVDDKNIELKIKKETMEELSKYLEERLKENVT